MNRAGTIIYCSGPYWSPEEAESLSGIARELERAGYSTYLPHKDGIEGLAWQWGAGSTSAREDIALQQAVLALEVYQVIERCHALVFNMNGRVPDEGGVFKTALAFAVGKPLVIYKNDNRSTFHGNDNSMVTGLTPAFATIKRIARLPAELERAFRKLPDLKKGRIMVPGHLRTTLDLGHGIWDLVEKRRSSGAGVTRKEILAVAEELECISRSHKRGASRREQ